MYNVHNVHLHDEVNYYKILLFDMSVFVFENYMQTLKHCIRKSTELVVQVVNRRCEIDKANSVKIKKNLRTKFSVNEGDTCILIKVSFIFFLMKYQRTICLIALFYPSQNVKVYSKNHVIQRY